MSGRPKTATRTRSAVQEIMAEALRQARAEPAVGKSKTARQSPAAYTAYAKQWFHMAVIQHWTGKQVLARWRREEGVRFTPSPITQPLWDELCAALQSTLDKLPPH